jgi:GNAT superfamily N-acetyltransferase
MASMTRIRRATAADVDIIVKHRRRMFADMGFGDEDALDAMAVAAQASIRSGLEDGSYVGWLAEDAGRVVAGGGLVIFNYQPSPSEPLPRRACVLNMYTAPEYRRRGLARRLLEKMIAWCSEHGFNAVSLHASEDGRSLYEAFGFKPTNEMRLVLK